MNVLGRKVGLRPGLFIAILILLLLLSSLLVYNKLLRRGNVTSRAQSEVCLEDDIGMELRKEYPLVTSQRAVEMSDIISRIEQLEGHEESVNCLAVLVRHYGYVSRFADVVNTYQTLKTVYDKTGIWADPSITSDSPEAYAQLAEIAQNNIDALNSQPRTTIPIKEYKNL